MIAGSSCWKRRRFAASDRKTVDIVSTSPKGFGGGAAKRSSRHFELFGIPFTGSDETTLCIALTRRLPKAPRDYRVKTPA
jgi:hypothetical protein